MKNKSVGFCCIKEVKLLETGDGTAMTGDFTGGRGCGPCSPLRRAAATHVCSVRRSDNLPAVTCFHAASVRNKRLTKLIWNHFIVSFASAPDGVYLDHLPPPRHHKH